MNRVLGTALETMKGYNDAFRETHCGSKRLGTVEAMRARCKKRVARWLP